MSDYQEAKIILDWDDGQWYISDFNQGTKNVLQNLSSISNTSENSGLKLASWDSNYKYNLNDLVGFEGAIYRSDQNQNRDNLPGNGLFWWKPLIDVDQLDATTLMGKTVEMIMLDTLGGNEITDYYKKTDVENLILLSSNNIDAKKLNSWSLEDIKNAYTSLILNSSKETKQSVIEHFTSEHDSGYQQELITLFDSMIANDNINKI